MKRNKISVILLIALTASLTASCKPLDVSAAETSTATVSESEGNTNENTSYTYEDLTYKIIDGSIIITDCDQKAKTVTIPSEIDGYKVTAIGDKAFYYSYYLTSVNIPDTVKTIGKQAFSNCDNLSTVNIPDSVTSLGEGAFYYCKSLTNITLPDSITTINATTFMYCKKLQSISLPSTLTKIGEEAFVNCYNLDNINLPNSLKDIDNFAFSGCSGFTDIILPNSVETIGNDSFAYCTNLYNIVLDDSLKSIGDEAFRRCDSLKSITLPSNLKTIGIRLFLDSNNFSNISVSEDNPYFYAEDNVLYNKDKTTLIYAANKSGSYQISDSVNTIDRYAFSNSENLTNVIIPNSITSIKDCAFSGCSSLTKLNFPARLKEIGSGVFNYCKNLESITIDENNPYLCSVDNVIYSKDMTELISCIQSKCDEFTVPESVTDISRYAFSDCYLSNIILPNNLRTIGEYAFAGCGGIEEFKLPNSVEEIGKGAFSNCNYLSKVNIPSNVTVINDNLFNNTQIRDIIFPSNVKKIGSSLFDGCYYKLTISILNKNAELSDNIIGDADFDELLIKGYSPSTAEDYASKNNINFEKLQDEKQELSFDNLSTNVPSPQIVGKNIKLIANATGNGPITYKFVVLKDNKAVFLRSYKEKNTILWQPQEAGDYVIKCSAKDANGNIKTKTLSYKINNKVVISDLKTSKISPAKAGASIKISSTATGEGTLSYKYTILKDGKYVTSIGFREKNSYIWQPTESGNYTIVCSVKD